MILYCQLTGAKFALSAYQACQAAGNLRGLHPALQGTSLETLKRILSPSVWALLPEQDKRLALLTVPFALGKVERVTVVNSPFGLTSPDGADLVPVMYPIALRLVQQGLGSAAESEALPQWAITAGTVPQGTNGWQALKDYLFTLEQDKSEFHKASLEAKAREIDADIMAKMGRREARTGEFGFTYSEAHAFLAEVTTMQGLELTQCARLLTVGASEGLVMQMSFNWSVLDRLETLLLQVPTFSDRKSLALRHIRGLIELGETIGYKQAAQALAVPIAPIVQQGSAANVHIVAQPQAKALSLAEVLAQMKATGGGN